MTGEIRNLTFFRNPQRFDDCRVCGQLVAQGCRDSDLKENHTSDWVTGCPKFLAMKTQNRRFLAVEAKFCLRCFDKDVIFSKNHNKDCYVMKQKKHRYSCTESSCTLHLLVCTEHTKVNEPRMLKMKERYETEGVKFVFHNKFSQLQQVKFLELPQNQNPKTNC